jgi:hypothetical protein
VRHLLCTAYCSPCACAAGTIATLMVDRNQAMAEYHQTSDRLGACVGLVLVRVSVRACMRAGLRACMCACVRACVRAW